MIVACKFIEQLNNVIMHSANSKSILFITGAFIGNKFCNVLRDFYENRVNPTTIIPVWLFKDTSPTALHKRRQDTLLALMRLPQLIVHLEEIARLFSDKPAIYWSFNLGVNRTNYKLREIGNP